LARIVRALADVGRALRTRPLRPPTEYGGKVKTPDLVAALHAERGHLLLTGRRLGVSRERVRQLAHERGLMDLVLSLRPLRKRTEQERQASKRKEVERAVARIRARRQADLCPCGRLPDPGKKTCQKCRSRDRKNQAACYHERIANGLCVRCNAPTAGTSYCGACLRKQEHYNKASKQRVRASTGAQR
jgi:hypothetical protein